ncbi:MAG: DUF885 family protein, partial [Pyrinomonadaceae bacterium]
MNHLKKSAAIFYFVAITLGVFTNSFAQTSDDLKAYNEPPSRLRGVIEKFKEDSGSVNRFYSAPTSPNRAARLRELYQNRLAFLNKQDFDALNHDEQIDYLLFKNYLEHENRELDRRNKQLEEMSALVPFMKTISDLEDSRRKLEPADPAKIAALLNDLNKNVEATQKGIEAGTNLKPKRTVANRAARTVASLRQTLKNWFNYYNGYDPMFTWWNDAPYKTVDASLQNYQGFLLDKLVGIKSDDKTTIIGDPIGREALLQELQYEMIPYTPEELIEIANKEFAWCEAEMKKASAAMGYDDDWKKALEAVKNKYVEPGKQP